MVKGLVFNIQRFTLHDGPGIRTEVFLKGCPLSCRWCSNPESRCAFKEAGVYPAKCIGAGACGACERSCPVEDCIRFHEDGHILGINRDACISCMRCAMACPSGAIKAWGQKLTVSQVMEEVRRDVAFYERSGGGVTVSGGEPLMQSAFAAQLLGCCRQEGIHTCLESTFYSSWKNIEPVISKADLIISDIKMMSDSRHRHYTGVSNRLILKNLKRLSAITDEIVLRIPLIPGVNDDEANITRTADFVKDELGGRIKYMQILEFMHLGEEKCVSLGRSYPMAGVTVDREQLHERALWIRDYFEESGIRCILGNQE